MYIDIASLESLNRFTQRKRLIVKYYIAVFMKISFVPLSDHSHKHNIKLIKASH